MWYAGDPVIKLGQSGSKFLIADIAVGDHIVQNRAVRQVGADVLGLACDITACWRIRGKGGGAIHPGQCNDFNAGIFGGEGFRAGAVAFQLIPVARTKGDFRQCLACDKIIGVLFCKT